MYLCKYINKTRLLGLQLKPDPSKGFECYTGTDFAGTYICDFAAMDPSTAKSYLSWYVFNAGCPIIWASKLQTLVALSTTEVEYIALSSTLCDVIPVMQLMEEITKNGFPILCTDPYVYCEAFEDNSCALELAHLPKL